MNNYNGLRTWGRRGVLFGWNNINNNQNKHIFLVPSEEEKIFPELLFEC
jgi:hypothetical protein